MDTFERGVISPHAIVSDGAQIGRDVTIGAFSVIHPGTHVGDHCIIGSHCVLGEPTAGFYSGDEHSSTPCVLGRGSVVRSHSIIYEGTTIGANLQLGHRVTIREGSTIGEGVRIGTMSDIQADVSVGSHVRMHSNVHIGSLSVIDDFVWLFPFVVLTNDPHPPSDTCTVGPKVKPYAVVATNSVLMPGVEIGEHSLVGAMSLVTRNVERETVVVGIPAKEVGSVRDVTCRHDNLDTVYPWPKQFRRGYPEGALPPPDHFGPR